MKDYNSKSRVFAYYLPQFHPIPENDLWWGKGFTEWTNVGKAKPLFHGHYQPKVPMDLGYYDLRVTETRKAQADLAKKYGIEGFIYWHYWFGNGKRLLERPFNEVLNSGEPDFPFALAWANESWKGFYHGLSDERAVLIEQKYYGDKDYIEHFNCILPALKDKRYIQIDGKPIFLIYHPEDIPDLNHFIELWNNLAIDNGLLGVYFIAICYSNSRIHELLNAGFNGINTNYFGEYKWHKRPIIHSLIAKTINLLYGCPNVVFYDDVSKNFITQYEYDENIYPTIYPNWDHSPRTGKKGTIIIDSSPKLFKECLQSALSTTNNKSDQHSIVFIKSWNEWAEGNYLEPDIKYGLSYLQAILDSLNMTKDE